MTDPELKRVSNKLEELAEYSSRGVVREFIGFVVQSKKWWLIPALAVLLLASIFVVLSGTVLAPFIYTLF